MEKLSLKSEDKTRPKYKALVFYTNVFMKLCYCNQSGRRLTSDSRLPSSDFRLKTAIINSFEKAGARF
ncbi:MAG: hypothetical protein PF590_03100 [Candidatus Delongbacteria bacterium]|nr:hypothetical protein [Candidatus Delongbacteria bacterium]